MVDEKIAQNDESNKLYIKKKTVRKVVDIATTTILQS